ncbi:MAG: helix-turn-helix domain-containing protein [Parabacteroides sp.]|nr:helix-turn-helix domain-containing protein [Parabacteroides sp.]
MTEIPQIEIDVLNAEIFSRDSFLNDLIVADIDGKILVERVNNTDVFRLNALVVLLVFDGTLEIDIDYTGYTLGANTFLTIMPTHILKFRKASESLSGRALIISRPFMEQTFPSKRSSNIHYMKIRKNPSVQLQPKDLLFLDKCMQRIREKIHCRTHFLQRDLLQNNLSEFFIEVANIMICRGEFLSHATLSRKEELLDKFLQLLFENCKKEHGVKFYADKLFITPQYLSLVLKEMTGKSANKWIDESLVVEAKILLKTPDITVQRVADLLNFSDQSTFGKFFKKHVGLSPMEFRKS